MATTNAGSRSREAWSLARRQHGVISRRQLLALGYSGAAIKHRIAVGRLHVVARGVYAVGRRELTREGRWTVALLACGGDAMLSHGSAAELWGVGFERSGIEITVRRPHRPRRRGVTVRSRPSLPPGDATTHLGIPVTTVARTLLDQAIVVERHILERQVNEAAAKDLIDPEALRAYLDRRAGEPGVRPLRVLLDRATFQLSDSELEVKFRPIARAAGLPRPLSKQIVNGFEVDFHFPDLNLVVECDSLRHHRTALKQKRDLVRDQTHVVNGLVPLRFSHWQVAHEPKYVAALLRRTARLLRPAPARARRPARR